MTIAKAASTLRPYFFAAEHLLDRLPAPLAGFFIAIAPATLRAVCGPSTQTERTAWLLAGVWTGLAYIVWRIGHDEKLVKVKVPVRHRHRAF
jgi:hypothetical protein